MTGRRSHNNSNKTKKQKKHAQRRATTTARAMAATSWVDRLQMILVEDDDDDVDVYNDRDEHIKEHDNNDNNACSNNNSTADVDVDRDHDDDDDGDGDGDHEIHDQDDGDDGGEDEDDSPPPSLSIVSWNVLAETYCNRRSQCHLPFPYQCVVFHSIRRRERLVHIVRDILVHTIQADCICFQELDMDDVGRVLRSMGYQGVETPRTKGGAGAGGRPDCCAVYVRTQQWSIVEHELIRLDDLATRCTTTTSTTTTASTTTTTTTTSVKNIENNNNLCSNESQLDPSTTTTVAHNSSNISSNSNNLQGIQQTFLRRNVALLVRIRHQATGQTVVIANAHLYWHPAFEHVKLCQTHYILQRANQFVQHHHDEPLVLCGDLNSRPGGVAHTYLVRGWIHAKRIAPWYNHHDHHHHLQPSSPGCFTDKDKDDDDQDRILIGQAIEANHELVTNDPILLVKDDDDDDDDDSSSQTKHVPLSVARSTGFPDVADSSLVNHVSKMRLNNDEVVSNIVHEQDVTDHTTLEVGKEDVPPIRYLLDATLNKLCRWLRILGIDAALETEEEEHARTGQQPQPQQEVGGDGVGIISDGGGGLRWMIFDRCKHEHRTLVTTSTRLMLRRDCPSSAYCINPSSLPNLEVVMVHMLLTHGVVLEPSKFLSRCVVCNGNIVVVDDSTKKRRILTDYQAPVHLGDNMDVYECDGCKQGYWWCDQPTSSASRVKNAATRLFQLCLRAGVPIRGDLDMFDYVNVVEERLTGWDFTIKGSELLLQNLDILEWLKQERLECPCSLESAYALKRRDMGERLPFTNVTSGFVNTLDYIFFDKKNLELRSRLYVPRSFDELNKDRIENGHLLPSDVWPSDHLAIGAVLSFKRSPLAGDNDDDADDADDHHQRTTTSTTTSTMTTTTTTPERSKMEDLSVVFCAPASTGAAASTSPPPPPIIIHQDTPRCTCGCIPKILSLFEMAELRNQIKLRSALQPGSDASP